MSLQIVRRFGSSALLIGLVLLGMTGRPTSAQGLDSRYLGHYAVEWSHDTGWHKHRLDLEWVGADRVQGRVGIDLGIGPVARAPQPDERFHNLPFSTARDMTNGSFSFNVEIADKTYEYCLFLMPGTPETIVGMLTIRGPDGATSLGVLARRTEEKVGD